MSNGPWMVLCGAGRHLSTLVMLFDANYGAKWHWIRQPKMQCQLTPGLTPNTVEIRASLSYCQISVDRHSLLGSFTQRQLTPKMALNGIMYSLITFITAPTSANFGINWHGVQCFKMPHQSMP